MNISVDIEIGLLEKLKLYTTKNDDASAVSEALVQFVRRHEKNEFIKSVLNGETDYDLTNEEIEADQYQNPRIH